jgi:hypothetical protein
MLGRVLHHLKNLRDVAIEDYLERHMRENPRYAEPLRLNGSEFQTFSQHGEDGIIEEIFNRIGTTNKRFVEFGCGNGLENNSALLLVNGWQGLWMDGSKENAELIKNKFASLLADDRLKFNRCFINAENVEALFKEGGVPAEPDFLSIDLDGNDYWIWKAIKNYRPRVVCMEFNGIFRPPTRWIMKYNPDHIWNGSVYYNSSLKSLELLGALKGYKLVGCDFTGVNSFFVREDLVGAKFLAPFTAENHYERNKAFLTKGHRHTPDFGAFAADPDLPA